MKTDRQEGRDIRELEKDLTVMEARLQTSYSRMGKSLLELADSEQRAINRLVDDIVAKKRQLSEARGEKQCPACMVFNDGDSRYCKHCGAELPDPPEEKKENPHEKNQ